MLPPFSPPNTRKWGPSSSGTLRTWLLKTELFSLYVPHPPFSFACLQLLILQKERAKYTPSWFIFFIFLSSCFHPYLLATPLPLYLTAKNNHKKPHTQLKAADFFSVSSPNLRPLTYFLLVGMYIDIKDRERNG